MPYDDDDCIAAATGTERNAGEQKRAERNNFNLVRHPLFGSLAVSALALWLSKSTHFTGDSLPCLFLALFVSQQTVPAIISSLSSTDAES